ncbi:MAG: XRE family transcriptional regulator [Oscillibacter sp.]|nr:XRE family transcriptional regulator [Oscillibacter sp.]
MANRMRELRLAHNEKQRDLAALLGLRTSVQYCKREIGYCPVTLEEAYKLALHWGMTIEEIFFADEVSLKESSA